jgi:UDP-GlcNAc:undecaprenyl-phosphate GlcNAc-1-phosphate transferase
LSFVTTEWLYVVSFAGALALSLILVPVVRTFAIRRTIVDTPGAHKSHQSPVPYLGGLAMVVAFSAAVIVGALLRQDTSFGDGSVLITNGGLFDAGFGPFGELLAVLGLALCLSAMGLIDDLRGLNPSLRLGIEFVIASALVVLGIQFQSPLNDSVDAIITLVWVIGITNAMNLLDNIDGLAAGVTAVAASAIFVIAILYEQPLTALLAVGLAGCTLGFLRSNFNPATIYMGDAGSLYLGFLLAYLSLKLRVDQTEWTQLFVPVVIMGVAILDTTLVVVSRLHRGVNPFEGGQDHISHRFLRLSVSVRRGVTVILMGAVVLGILGIALAEMDARHGWLVLTAIAVHGVAVVILLTTKRAQVAAEATTDNVTTLPRKAL